MLRFTAQIHKMQNFDTTWKMKIQELTQFVNRIQNKSTVRINVIINFEKIILLSEKNNTRNQYLCFPVSSVWYIPIIEATECNLLSVSIGKLENWHTTIQKINFKSQCKFRFCFSLNFICTKHLKVSNQCTLHVKQ